MTASTPKLQIPYVQGMDRILDYPVHSKARADRLEKLMTVPTWISPVFTAANGWAVDSQTVQVLGALAFIEMSARRTGAAISVDSTGNCSNEWVATFTNPATIKFQAYGPMTTTSGRGATFYIDPVYNAVVIQAVAGKNWSIGTGHSFYIVGVFMIVPSPTLNP